MAYLVKSLRLLFNEIDATWPRRDHGLDGWIGDKKHCPGTSDHCADDAGRVHAIDIDKDGISLDYIISKLTARKGVIRYINWNRKQYHVRNNYAAKPLGGDNPHTGHAHVSIERTDTARNYDKGYGIYAPISTPPIVIPELSLTPQTEWDHSAYVFYMGGTFAATGDILSGYSNAIAGIRR